MPGICLRKTFFFHGERLNRICVFQWKFKKYLDHATKNANRIWAGTNKSVFYNKNDKPITFDILVKMIKAHEASIARAKAKEQAEMSSKYIRCNRNFNFENVLYGDVFFFFFF